MKGSKDKRVEKRKYLERIKDRTGRERKGQDEIRYATGPIQDRKGRTGEATT
jgi:hypothetical protein